VVSAVLANVDAVQDLLILRRYLGEKLYVVRPALLVFARRDISPEEPAS